MKKVVKPEFGTPIKINSNRFLMGKVGNTTIPNYEYSTINEKMNWTKVEIGTENSKKLEMLVDWVDSKDGNNSSLKGKNTEKSVFDVLPNKSDDSKKYDLNQKNPEEDIN